MCPAPRTESLRVASFLAPRLLPLYEDVAGQLADELGRGGGFEEAGDPRALAEGWLELGFLCGLPYTALRDAGADVEPIAAPVFAGGRYAHRAIYFSDVIVRAGEAAESIEELAGRRIAFNEPGSHSGYNALAAELASRSLPDPHFGAAVRTGAHERSIAAVLDAEADVAAIDSQVLDAFIDQEPERAAELRIVEAVGPSPAPPLVAGSSLAPADRERLRLRMASTRSDSPAVEGWIAVADADYDPIREMRARARSRVGL